MLAYEKVRGKSRLPNWRIRDQSTAVEKEEEEPGVANLLPRPSFGGDEQPTAWLGEEWSELVSSLSLALILSGLEEGEEEDGERGKRPLPLPLLPSLLPKPTPPPFLCDSDGGPNFICPGDIQMAEWEWEAGAAAG